MKSAALAILATTALTACSLAPSYQRPEMPAPASYKEAGEWKTAQPADTIARGEWWKIYGDDELNTLQSQLGEANQNLKAALARFSEARALARVARADYFPTIGANVSMTREHPSQNKALASASAPSNFNDFLLSADLSYEVDVWGRVRNAAEAGKDSAQASAADLATLELSTRAELAMDYFSLRAADSEQALLGETVSTYQKAFELTQNRYRGGAAAVVDVDQAQVQLENAKTQASETTLKRAQLEHAIAVLVGVPASQFSLAPAPLAISAPAIDAGLPSQLLERRPDIAAAERRVASANASIGVAKAAYFPVFSLGAIFGVESGQSSSWFDAPSKLWSFGPAALLTVFDGGRRHALSDQARAAHEETVANYRQSVLNAYREVEDNLTAVQQLEKASASQTIAVNAAQRAQTQANYRYKGGVATYLEVASAQSLMLQGQLNLASLQARRLNASVLLIKALGGGWHAQESSQ
jgi:NodT family efflux transporter outer membrane factor (OMF) lipoprotein